MHPTELAERHRAILSWRVSLLALTLVSFVLRAHRLAAQSLWSDEDITFDRALKPLAELIGSLPIEHAPLYFALMRGWTKLAGTGDFALRYPSVVCGVLAVPLAACVGRVLVGRRAGLVLALVMAVNPFLVWYGQEARMYTLVLALSLGAVVALLRAEATRGAVWWVAAGLALALTVYAHYYGALVVFALLGWALLDIVCRRAATMRGWLIAGTVSFLAFAPWLTRALAVFEFGGWREQRSLAEVPGVLLAAWSAGPTIAAEHAIPIAWLYSSLVAAGLVVLLRAAFTPVWDGMVFRGIGALHAQRALLLAVLPAAVGALLLARNPDFHPRYYFAALPAFYLLVSTGAVAMPRRLDWLAATLLVVAAVRPLINLYADPAYQKQDYRGFVQTVESAAGHEDTVLFLDGPGYGLVRRYEMEDSPVKIVNLQSTGNAARTLDERYRLIEELAREYPHLWLATDGTAEGDAQRWLDFNAATVSSSAFQDVNLRRYYFDPSLAALGSGTPGTIGGMGRSCPDEAADRAEADCRPVVLGIDLGGRGAIEAGEVLAPCLVWEATAPIRGPHKISLRLVSRSSGEVVASVDRATGTSCTSASEWLPGEPIVDCHGLYVPDSVAPGRYELQVVLYDERTLRPLGTWTGPTLEVRGAP